MQIGNEVKKDLIYRLLRSALRIAGAVLLSSLCGMAIVTMYHADSPLADKLFSALHDMALISLGSIVGLIPSIFDLMRADVHADCRSDG